MLPLSFISGMDFLKEKESKLSGHDLFAIFQPSFKLFPSSPKLQSFKNHPDIQSAWCLKMTLSPKISINLIAFAKLLYGLFKNLSPPAINFSFLEFVVHASL